METNTDVLRARFVRRLLAERPSSVLDIGCGRGALLLTCREAGVPAEGVEPDAACVEACKAQDLVVRQGDATPLPHASASVDWVTLRHVPHHLEEPRDTLAEAWRVARTGVLVAEPWYDSSFPSQRLGDRLDRLLKRFDRARGMFHADSLSPRELLELLPPEAADVELETYLRPLPWPVEELDQDVSDSLGGLDPTPELAAELAELRARVAAGGATRNGTAMVVARKKRA